MRNDEEPHGVEHEKGSNGGGDDGYGSAHHDSWYEWHHVVSSRPRAQFRRSGSSHLRRCPRDDHLVLGSEVEGAGDLQSERDMEVGQHLWAVGR